MQMTRTLFRAPRRALRAQVLPLAAILCAMSCTGTPATDDGGLTVWFHAGRQSERDTIRRLVDEFNAQHAIHVELTMIPEGSYNAQVTASAVAGELPDLVELDGPFLYRYVWQGILTPLDKHLSAEVRDDLLPSILEQGRYRGRLYAVGQFDSGLGLYGRRSHLEEAGVRIPQSASEAWSVTEFAEILDTLAQRDDDGAVLDLKLNYEGEWFTYAFSPAIQSAGGDLIDRSDYQSADGVLNGPEAVSAMQTVQSWITEGYVDPNVDDAAFTQGRVALSWSGHWDHGRYQDAVGEDLVLLPLPDFGNGSRTGQGSWCWGITTACNDPQAAMQFLEFLLEPQNVLAMTDANAAVPSRQQAIARSDRFGQSAPLQLFVEQLRSETSIPRPKTPAYPIITSAFQEAFGEIRNGGQVQAALDRAVATIDQEIQDNQGYPFDE